jgi:hypothetical protein
VNSRAAVILGAVLGTLGLPRLAAGQGPTASVPAEAVIVTVGMTLTTVRDLSFGTVTQGVATTVLPTAANAGAWQMTGNANAFVSIAFTLPTQLTNIQALPGSTMPISFSGTSAIWRRANNDPVGGNVFDPVAGATGRFGPPANPTLYIWIGGTVNPAPTAKPGIYEGTVVLSVTYL